MNAKRAKNRVCMLALGAWCAASVCFGQASTPTTTPTLTPTPTRTPTWTPTPTITPTILPGSGLYYTGITHAVNGLTANAIFIWCPNDSEEITSATLGLQRGSWWSDVYIRHANGSETQIGSHVAYHEEYPESPPEDYSFSGFRESVWQDPPLITLEPNDAIKIIEYVQVGDLAPASTTFISRPLWGGQLSGGNWLFSRNIYYQYYDPIVFIQQSYTAFRYGSLAYSSRVANIITDPADRPVPIHLNFQPDQKTPPSGFLPISDEFFTDFMGFGWR